MGLLPPFDTGLSSSTKEQGESPPIEGERKESTKEMRVNVYAEEMTDRIEIISKEIEGEVFTGLRIYLELPATVGGNQYQGPFIHRPGDDDSSAVTFWGKRDVRVLMQRALILLNEHYAQQDELDEGIIRDPYNGWAIRND